MRIPSSVFLLAVAAILALPAGALAADNPATAQARQHYQKAQNAYDLGRWDEAIVEYEAAYSLRPDPTFLFNMAQACRRKGDTQRALDLYRNYLVKAPDTPQRADVEDKIRVLKKQLEEEQGAHKTPESVPSLPVVPAPAADSPAAAAATAPAAAAPSSASPTSTPATAAVDPTAPSATSSPAGELVASSPLMPSSEGRALRITGITLGAIGAAAIVGGVLMGARAKSLADELTSAANNPAGGTFNRAKYDSGKTAETLQWVGYGVGAAALIGGSVLYWLGLPKGSAVSAGSVSFRVAPHLAPDRVGGQLVATF